MDKAHILALYDRDQRREVEYPDMRREVTPSVVRLVGTLAGGEGAVIHTRLDESRVETAIREQVAYFESLGQDFEWKLYDYDQPPDLKARLAAHGFEVEAAEAIMVLDLKEAPPALARGMEPARAGPASPSVRRITDPARIEDVLAIEEAVWGEDYAELGRYLARALAEAPARLSVYVAYVDGRPASAAWIYFPPHSRFASLWGGSTQREYRGRGLYTALLAARAREAQARGVAYLTVDASPMSQPILEKHGFVTIAYAYPCKYRVVKR